MASVTWLHLSDWHQRGDTFDRMVVRDALLKDIRERCQGISSNLEKIDFIVLSGDIAHFGKPEEYAAVSEHFIKPLLEATGLGPERLFIVPGNHDLDRDAFDLLPSAILAPFTAEADVQGWLKNDRKRARLLEPFEAYDTFVSAYGAGVLSSYASKLQVDIEGREVVLLGFNSALMAARNKNTQGKVDDEGHLIVGEPQVYDVLADSADADLRIAVLHHPLPWLTKFDRDRVKGRLLKGVDCILCGHQHEAQVEIVNGTLGECVIIPAGAAYDRRDYANGYNFVILDLATRRGTVFLRCWSNNTVGIWREDVDCAPKGKYDFSLGGDTRQVSGLCAVTETDEMETDVVTTAARFDPRNPVFYLPYRKKGDSVIGREEALAKHNLLSSMHTSTAKSMPMASSGSTPIRISSRS